MVNNDAVDVLLEIKVKKSKFTNLIIYFQEVCSDFTVEWGIENEWGSSDLRHTIEIKDNKSLTVKVIDHSLDKDKEYLFDKIEIRFHKVPIPKRYIKINEIDFGIYDVINDEDIRDFNIIQETNIICEEFPLNSCEITLFNNNKIYDPLNPNNKIDQIIEGKQIGIYHYLKVGNKWEEKQLGFFNIERVENLNNQLNISCSEPIPEDLYYGSNLYKGEKKISVILTDLFSYFNYYNYELDPRIDEYDEPEEGYEYGYFGYVPVVEFREALRLICEAGCLSIKKKKNGILYITKRLNLTNEKFDDNNTFNLESSKKNKVFDVRTNRGLVIEPDTEIYSGNMPGGIHMIEYSSFPIDPSTIRQKEPSEDFYMEDRYAAGAKVRILKSEYLAEWLGTKYTFKYFSLVGSTSNTANIIENQLLYNDSSVEYINAKNVYNWKNSISPIEYELETLMLPYLETLDRCYFINPYTKKKEPFYIEKIEFSKSLKQRIRGRFLNENMEN